MNETDSVLYMRPQREDQTEATVPTWTRQTHALEIYWASKFGYGPAAATYILFSVTVLGFLYIAVTPWFVLHSIYKALRA